MGARVVGLALEPESQSLFGQARIDELVDSRICDIRDAGLVRNIVEETRPEIVFHLAAQPLVRLSYHEPVETFATNVQGTVHVLDACRHVDSVKAIVCVTSDKCYENREWVWPYRECDPMGGHDPYSASKGAAEIAIASYRRSFFSSGGPLLASVRAGNVIGGGDWAADRLIPDIVRAILAGTEVEIRSPSAVRPWQHVLEALGGYLAIAERMIAGDAAMADGWNFGPSDDDTRPVSWILSRMIANWGQGSWTASSEPQPHEAHLLRLDSSKVRRALGWRPAWGLERALDAIVHWHRAVAGGEDARTVSVQQLNAYISDLSNLIVSD